MFGYIKSYVGNGTTENSKALRMLTVFLTSILLSGLLISGMYQISLYYEFSDLYASIINKIDFEAIKSVFMILKNVIVYSLSNFLLVLLILSGVVFWLSSKIYLKELPFELRHTFSDGVMFLCFMLFALSGLRILFFPENINSSIYELLVYLFSANIYLLFSLSPVLFHHKRVGDTINCFRFTIWKNFYCKSMIMAYVFFALLGIVSEIGVLFVMFLPVLLFMLTAIIVEAEIGKNQFFKYNTLKNRGIVFKAEDVEKYVDIESVIHEFSKNDKYRPYFSSTKELEKIKNKKYTISPDMLDKLKTMIAQKDVISEDEVLALYFTKEFIHIFDLRKRHLGNLLY